MTLAADFIKHEEGLRLKSYKDGGGVWTIGWGHTGAGVKKGQTISHEQAEEFLRHDMGWALQAVEDTVKVGLTTGQHAATTSLILNIGETQWKSSTALRRLNQGDYDGAAEAMTWWKKDQDKNGKLVTIPGLVARRERERKLFLSVAPDDAPVPVHRGTVKGGEAKPQVKSKTQWLAGAGATATVMSAVGQTRSAVPEFVAPLVPYIPWVMGAVALIFIAIMVNRWWDSRKGIH